MDPKNTADDDAIFARLRRILVVHFALWQAIVSSSPDFPLEYIHHAHSDVERQMEYYEYDFVSSSETVRGDPTPAGSSQFWAQYAMTNLCDEFCALFLGHVKTLLKNYPGEFGDGVKVKCLVFFPRPASYIFYRRSREMVKHSVLEIVLPNGTTWIFDGTIAQYGWDLTKYWLISAEEYHSKFVDPEDAVHHQREDAADRQPKDAKDSDDEMEMEYERFWKMMPEFVHGYLDDLDWDPLKELSVRDISERVAYEAREILFVS
ncbi:hypothetical protein ACEQ8H_008599 [Pleosporales sp. CAS-2024a]